LLDGKERSADAIAIQFTEVLVLERRDFLRILERNPRAAILMLEVLCATVFAVPVNRSRI
jgi:CRP-like cAMP-binding protein